LMVLFLCWIPGTSAAAEPPDVFGMEVGNSCTYEMNDGFTTVTDDVVAKGYYVPTRPNKELYVVERTVNGSQNEAELYERKAGKLKLWGGTAYMAGMRLNLEFSIGLLVAWYPMSVGDSRYTGATVTVREFPGYVFNGSLTVNVLAKKQVALSFGTVTAYKIRYQERVWGYGEDESFTFVQWAVPYLGIVKYNEDGSVAELSSFAIAGGSITQDTDYDTDGLKDYEEFCTYGTDYQNDDSDGDTLLDGEEINTYQTNPSKADTDGDGLDDAQELQSTGTNPHKADSDDDGMPDGWEVQYGLDPLVNDASLDEDLDGFSNLKEYLSGTDPTDSEDVPDAVVLTPNGGEVMTGGSTVPVQWKGPARADHFALKYTLDNGVTWETIEGGLTAKSYDWTLPVPKKTKNACLVKVIGYNASGSKVCADRSDALFTIKGLTLTAPAGGEALASGDTYDAAWEANGTESADHVTLFYSMDNGAIWTPIDTLMENPGTYAWNVPVPGNNKKNCLLKLIAYDDAGKKIGVDTSEAPFAIEVVKLDSPNGGEVLSAGGTYSVAWSTNETKSPVANVKLLYTKNGGSTWSLVEKMDGNPGNYEWTVPAVNKNKTRCMVKILLKDADGNTVGKDLSDETFTIEP